MALSPNEVLDREPTLLKDFPNRYTFAKHLTEKALTKLRGNLPFAITRPSFIVCSVRDPAPGWTDTIAAAGVVVFTLGNG
mmetsp:Transcript_25957/g.18401  ORF Transcript_25957/g.18401 Transcript_25957/m.18401 type:complete len:80 (+) Transcript_25957:626-865(+)